MKIAPAALALALVAGLAACNRSPAPDAASAPADPAATAATAAATPGAAVDESPLKLAELDAYARGMQQEITLLRAANAKVEQARMAKDDAAAASAAMEMATLDTEVEGAKAAGLAQARYLFVKNIIETALGKAEMQAALKAMGADENPAAADPADLPPEQRQQVEAGRAEMQAGVGDPYEGLAADVAAAFRARQAELGQLRSQAVGIRMNVGG